MTSCNSHKWNRLIPAAFGLLIVQALWSDAVTPVATADVSRTVIDARGKAVSIPSPFRGTVIYPFVGGTVLTEYLTVTQDPRSVLAATKIQGGEARELVSLSSRVFPGIQEIRDDLPDNSIRPNLETLLVLNPSAVIQWSNLADTNAFMERLGLNLVTIAPNRQEDWIPQTARIFSEVAGSPERGQALAARFQQNEEELARDLAPTTLSQRPSVLRIWVDPTGRITAMGRGRFSPSFISRAGGTQAAPVNSDWVSMEMERLILLDPDVILLESGVSRSTPAELFSRPEWQGLKAIKTRRVYWEPCMLSYSVDYPLYCRWLAELLHPECFQLQFREILKQRYLQDLDYRMSDADIDAFLAVAENRHSAGYERFIAREALQ